MKTTRLLLLLAMSVCTSAGVVQAQTTFPHNETEDTEGVMSKAYWELWNQDVQQRIDADIEAYRKADGLIHLDKVKPGTEISVEQLTSDFIFGAHIFNFDQLGKKEYNDRYKELYGTLFNSATVAFYWRKFETEQNRPRFCEEYWDTEEYWNNCESPKTQSHWRRPSTDKAVDYCLSRGIRVHGHPLIWGSIEWHKPDWIWKNFQDEEERPLLDSLLLDYGMNNKTGHGFEHYSERYNQMSQPELENRLPHLAEYLRRLYEQRIRLLAKRYEGKITSWDVCNESATDFSRGSFYSGQKLCKSVYGLMPGDYAFRAFEVATDAFPDSVKLNINDYNLSQSYVDQVKEYRDRGAKIDIMGSQMHLFNPQQCRDIAQGAAIQTPDYIRDWYSRLSTANLPIHLSEITITSPGTDEKSRQIQAVIARNLYRLWFSLPQMMGITWWNVVDDCGAPGEPSVSGLFTRDMQPKTSYFALNELINDEWKTRTTVQCDNEGNVRFRGFRGKYRISWKDRKGREHSETYHLK